MHSGEIFHEKLQHFIVSFYLMYIFVSSFSGNNGASSYFLLPVAIIIFRKGGEGKMKKDSVLF